MVSGVTLETMIGVITPAPSLISSILSQSNPKYFGVVICFSVGEILTQSGVCVQIRHGSKYGSFTLAKSISVLKRHILIISNIAVVTHSNPLATRARGIAHIVVLSEMRIWLANPRITSSLESRQTAALARVLCGIKHA